MKDTSAKPYSKKPVPNPEQAASFPNRLLFQWIHPLIRLGSTQPLQPSDLPPLHPDDTAQLTHPIFQKAYINTQENPPTFLSKTYQALLPVIWPPFLKAAFSKPFWLIGAIAQAFSIRALVTYVIQAQQSNAPSRWFYIPVCLALALSAMLMSVAEHAVFSGSMRAGMRARAALSAQIFRKTLRLSPSALATISEGQIANLLLNDTQRVLDSFTYSLFCPFGFVEILVMSALLCIDLGYAALFGLLVLIFLIPIQVSISRLVKRARIQTTAQVDLRVQKVTEILSGIRTIKLSAWEPHFINLVGELRRKEVCYLKVAAMLRASNAAVFFATPVMVALAAFTARTILFRQPLSPATIFSSLSYFGAISHSLNLMPLGFLAASEATVSSQRLDAFFDLPELQPDQLCSRITHRLPSLDHLDSSETSSDCLSSELDDAADHTLCKTDSINDAMPRLWTENAQFSYAQPVHIDNTMLSPAITDISFSVDDGQLLSIIGPVGSGKTSLLLGLLGEILCTHGEVRKHGRVAYCAQQPWIVNGTMRHNITMFGEDNATMDEQWYQTVLDACCLLPDLQLLPADDLTEIGERGINLSGGQKARIALARAVYSRADIYLLDDPLSAVDAAVSARLIRAVFGQNGLLADKAQLIVTHQLNLLPISSKVAVLGSGTIDHIGTFQELCEQDVEFSGFFGQEHGPDKDHNYAARNDVGSEGSRQNFLRHIFKNANVHQDISGKTCSSSNEARCDSKVHCEEYESSTSSAEMHADITADIQCTSKQRSDTESCCQKGELVTKEHRSIGRVTTNIYHAYVKAGGGYLALFFLGASFVAAQSVRQVSEWWLSRWSDVAAANANGDALFQENRFHALVYFGLTASTMLLTLTRAALFAERTMAASKNLHNQLIDRVFHARTSFFDTNPMGRILNRFSKDVDQMDSMLPVAAQDCLQMLFVALGSLITISVILPWFILPLVPIVVGFVILQRMYKKSSRELKRIEAVSRSPLYAQFVETVNGLSTIRAHKTEGYSLASFTSKVDANHVSYHTFASAGRWLGIRLDALAALVAFSTSLVVLILSPSLNPGLAGFALTQSIVLTGNFQCKLNHPTNSTFLS